MLHSLKTWLRVSALLIALTATSKAFAASFTPELALLAQTAPTSFPLPSTLPEGSTVRVDGSSSMSTINAALKARFEEKFAGTTVELADNGTDAALQSLRDGSIDLAAIGRPLTEAERAEGLIEVPISREKIAVIVGPDNPFKGNLTFEQFAAMFRGEITDWSEVGGAPGPIRFIDRPDSSDTRLSLSRYEVFQSPPFAPGSITTQVAEDDTAAVIEELGSDGISYAIASQVLDQNNVRVVSMHNTLPDDPRYPYSQPRGYVYKNELSPVVQAFLGFATSEPGQEVVAEAKEEEAAAVAEADAPATAADAAAPGAAEPPETALAPAPATAADAAVTGRGFPWWLLAIPVVGGLLWWLLRGRGEEEPLAAAPAAPPDRLATVAAPPAAAVPPVPAAPAASAPPAPVAPPAPSAAGIAPLAGVAAAGAVAGAGALLGARSPDSRIVLTPRDSQSAYAYWEAPEAHRALLREQGGRQLKLRLYDVTDIDLDRQPAHSVKEFACSETEPDLHVPIEQPDRDYLAEVGYVTNDGRWLKLARSEHVRVPAATLGRMSGLAAGGAVLAAGATAQALANQSPPEAAAPARTVAPSHITLEARRGNEGYAFWEVPESSKAALRSQGGSQLALRVYDVTGGVDLDQQPDHRFQQYVCSEYSQDRQITVPVAGHDYVAEIGYLTTDDRWLKLARSNAVRIGEPEAGMGAAIASAGAGVAGAAALGAAAIAAGAGAIARTLAADEQSATSRATTSDRCAIANVIVHSQRNCFRLSPEEMSRLQQTAASTVLEPGTYIIRIKRGKFSYAASPDAGEPLVLLWVYGGRVVNQKTNVEVNATWSSLNGYEETLNLAVLQSATLCAFFLDTHLPDNEGEITVSAVRP